LSCVAARLGPVWPVPGACPVWLRLVHVGCVPHAHPCGVAAARRRCSKRGGPRLSCVAARTPDERRGMVAGVCCLVRGGRAGLSPGPCALWCTLLGLTHVPVWSWVKRGNTGPAWRCLVCVLAPAWEVRLWRPGHHCVFASGTSDWRPRVRTAGPPWVRLSRRGVTGPQCRPWSPRPGPASPLRASDEIWTSRAWRPGGPRRVPVRSRLAVPLFGRTMQCLRSTRSSVAFAGGGACPVWLRCRWRAPCALSPDRFQCVLSGPPLFQCALWRGACPVWPRGNAVRRHPARSGDPGRSWLPAVSGILGQMLRISSPRASLPTSPKCQVIAALNCSE